MSPFLRLSHALPPRFVFGNEPGVRRIKIYQAGSSQHKLRLCVTNVVVHGPGVKLPDGLAEAKHQWGCDLLLPLPSTSYHLFGTLLGLGPLQFLPVIGLDAGQLGYSLATRVMVPNRRPSREEGRHPFREWVPPLLATMGGSASLDGSRRQEGAAPIYPPSPGSSSEPHRGISSSRLFK